MSFTKKRTASMFGVCWNPPIKSQSRRSANGVFEPGTSTIVETISIDLSGLASQEKLLFHAAHHPGLIGLVNEIVFQLFLPRLFSRLRVVGDLGLSIGAKKM